MVQEGVILKRNLWGVIISFVFLFPVYPRGAKMRGLFPPLLLPFI